MIEAELSLWGWAALAALAGFAWLIVGTAFASFFGQFVRVGAGDDDE